MTKDKDSGQHAGMAFGEALERMSQTDPWGATEVAKESMLDSTIDDLINQFEDAAQVDEGGVEFWCARDLQQLLAYTKWDNFLEVVTKAKIACDVSGADVDNHFADVGRMVPIGSGAEREVPDIRLNRYACCLVAQNGDSRKRPVAFAQTYFAIQTRRQEVQDDDLAHYTPLTEDQKRLLLRGEIKEHNKKLASAAKGAGVIAPIDFAVFQTFGYKGLYGGLDRSGIRRRKGLRPKQHILDHMGSTELAANLFRATQTEEKLRRDNVQGKDAANATHYRVGQEVRQAIGNIGGTMPEDLAPAEDIVKVARQMKKAIASGAKRIK